MLGWWIFILGSSWLRICRHLSQPSDTRLARILATTVLCRAPLHTSPAVRRGYRPCGTDIESVSSDAHYIFNQYISCNAAHLSSRPCQLRSKGRVPPPMPFFAPCSLPAWTPGFPQHRTLLRAYILYHPRGSHQKRDNVTVVSLKISKPAFLHIKCTVAADVVYSDGVYQNLPQS